MHLFLIRRKFLEKTLHLGVNSSPKSNFLFKMASSSNEVDKKTTLLFPFVEVAVLALLRKGKLFIAKLHRNNLP